MSIVCILYHSISCIIFHLVFLSSASGQCQHSKCRSTDIIWNLYTYENPNHPSPMQRVVVHNATKDVFVGARNTLYVFNSNLRVKRIVSTGPELDHPECLHPSYPCDYNRTETDNDNKVLQIFQMPSSPILLLNCGTLYQGLCQIGTLSQPARTWIQPYNDTVGFISGKASTVAFFAQGYNNHLSLYSASTYDGRPTHYSPASVSSKVIVGRNSTITFKYSDKTDTSFTGVNFGFRENYKVEYVTGFDHGDYVYFLTTQKVSVESEVIETRLARVCKNDNAFFSYTEVPLKCQYMLHVYNLATAAHLGVASPQLKRRLKLDKLIDVLYVSFSKTLPDHGRLADGSKGSVICSFPMSTVIASFSNATRDCFKAEPRSSLLKHVTGMSLSCTKKDLMQNYDDFCGSGFNHYIEGRESILGGFRNHFDDQITSLATILQKGKSIAIAGTDKGDILKIEMDMRSSEDKKFILYQKNIAQDQEDKKIQSSNAFDPLHENIYFLAGKKIVKFPIGSCSPYTDCQSCLTMNDPLMCGWCGDHCAHREECETPDLFSTNTCSPVIFNVYPLYGPTEGGTLITVEGDNFGASQTVIDGDTKLSITVAGIPCKIHLWQKEKIQCKTNPGKGDTDKGPVEISVHDFAWDYGSFDMNGTARSSETFTYLKPILYGIYPGKGPVSGGTNITLYGSNLNVGHTATIRVAGVSCTEIGIRQIIAWCVTDGLFNGSSLETDATRTGPVEIHIDDAVIKIENEIDAALFQQPLAKIFRYLPDPEIIGIAPEATTVSGIKNLTIKGKYLNSVENSKMIVNFGSSITGESLHVISDLCWLNNSSDGSTMFCPTPPLQSSAFHVPTERAPLVTHIGFLMDGVKKLRELPKHEMELSKLLYYPDPEFHNLVEGEGALTVPQDQTTLEIYGKYLNLALDETDVKVFFDNVTACPVEKITFDSISCLIPPLEEFDFTNTSKHSVMVLAGSLVFPVGSIEFVTGGTNAAVRVMGYIFAVLAIIAVISIILYYKIARRKKKKYPNFSIRFTPNTHPNTCNNTVSRQTSNCNDYQDLPGRRTNRQNSAASAIPGDSCQRAASISSVDEETIHLLESQNILVPRNYLTLGEIIGEGHFGCVYKGELMLPPKGNKVEVAVKTLHNSWSTIEQDSEAFLQEGLMMKDFHHHNVLTLIGVCFDSDGFPMVIIPFMKHGDLLSYIRNENSNPTIKDLLMFGVQIASGMKYLAEIKFVHRDLAGRNCMLDDDQTVKVADFGLSRDIYERDYYKCDNKKTKLPIKWMAPESIEKGTYTTKSDVWSYGVVLWELMTRGVAPYPGVDNWDILQYIKLGRRMPQPSYCPDLLYEIMMKCWDEDPNKRPTFAELQKEVEGVITKLQRKNRQRTVGLNVTYVNCPQILPKATAEDT